MVESLEAICVLLVIVVLVYGVLLVLLYDSMRNICEKLQKILAKLNEK